MPQPSVPTWRWKVAGAVRAHMPDVKGRGRLSRLVFGQPGGTTTISFGPDLVFDLNLDDFDQNTAWFFQFEQPALAPLLDHVLREGDVVADVGANMGTYTCWSARAVGPTGQVHAFEPVPSTRAVLERHVEQNGLHSIVRVNAAAVGDRAGETTLYEVPGVSGWSAAYPRGEGSVPVTAPVVVLDDYFADRPHPRLVKIDVEGFEPNVLRGMTRLAGSPVPPIIAMELCDVLLRQAGSSAAEVYAQSRALGYDVYEVTPAGIRFMPKATTEEVNTVLLHPVAHQHEVRLLSGTRFPRDYTA